MNQAVVGSNPIGHPKFMVNVTQWQSGTCAQQTWVRFPSFHPSLGPVAQLVERLPEEQGVVGSNPTGSAR